MRVISQNGHLELPYETAIFKIDFFHLFAENHFEIQANVFGEWETMAIYDTQKQAEYALTSARSSALAGYHYDQFPSIERIKELMDKCRPSETLDWDPDSDEEESKENFYIQIHKA